MDADIKILKDEKERVIIAGIHTGSRDYINDTTDESMRELTELVETAGGEVVGELVQNRPAPDSGTYLGEGKLEELKNDKRFKNGIFVGSSDSEEYVEQHLQTQHWNRRWPYELLYHTFLP